MSLVLLGPKAAFDPISHALLLCCQRNSFHHSNLWKRTDEAEFAGLAIFQLSSSREAMFVSVVPLCCFILSFAIEMIAEVALSRNRYLFRREIIWRCFWVNTWVSCIYSTSTLTRMHVRNVLQLQSVGSELNLFIAGEELGEVDRCRYLGSYISSGCCIQDELSYTCCMMDGHPPIWRIRSVSVIPVYRVCTPAVRLVLIYHSHVTVTKFRCLNTVFFIVSLEYGGRIFS